MQSEENKQQQKQINIKQQHQHNFVMPLSHHSFTRRLLSVSLSLELLQSGNSVQTKSDINVGTDILRLHGHILPGEKSEITSRKCREEKRNKIYAHSQDIRFFCCCSSCSFCLLCITWLSHHFVSTHTHTNTNRSAHMTLAKRKMSTFDSLLFLHH